MTMDGDNLPAPTGGWDLGWEIVAFNGSLRRRRQERGLLQRQVARAVGVSSAAISHYETLRLRPTDDVRDRLAQLFDCSPQEIWPDWLEARRERLRATNYQKINAVKFSALESRVVNSMLSLPAPAEESPLAQAEVSDGRERICDALELVLKTLTYREREVIKMRYGLNSPDGQPYTLEEVSRIFKVNRERVRQIEAKALRKISTKTRRAKLADAAKDHLDLIGCAACSQYFATAIVCRDCGGTYCHGCCSCRRILKPEGIRGEGNDYLLTLPICQRCKIKRENSLAGAKAQ